MKHRLCMLCLVPALWASALFSAAAAAPVATGAVTLEIPGQGTLLAQPAAPSAEGEPVSQLVFRKPGGMAEIVGTYEGLRFQKFFRADLDGDQVSEIIAAVRAMGSEEIMPMVFQGSGSFAQIFPRPNEANPIFGREVSIVPRKEGPTVCVRLPVTIHDFGPPQAFRREYYRLQGGTLTEVARSFDQGTHFNIAMNRAGFYFQQGRYLEALQGYEALTNGSAAASLPPEALGEALFYEAEARKFLKDVPRAIELYQRVVLEHSDSAFVDEAQRTCEFLSMNLQSMGALHLYIDLAKLAKQGKWQEVLLMLNRQKDLESSPTLGAHFLFLQAEAWIAVGKIEEALKVLSSIKQRFPESPLLEDVESTIQELDGMSEQDGL